MHGGVPGAARLIEAGAYAPQVLHKGHKFVVQQAALSGYLEHRTGLLFLAPHVSHSAQGNQQATVAHEQHIALKRFGRKVGVGLKGGVQGAVERHENQQIICRVHLPQLLVVLAAEFVDVTPQAFDMLGQVATPLLLVGLVVITFESGERHFGIDDEAAVTGR